MRFWALAIYVYVGIEWVVHLLLFCTLKADQRHVHSLSTSAPIQEMVLEDVGFCVHLSFCCHGSGNCRLTRQGTCAICDIVFVCAGVVVILVV